MGRAPGSASVSKRYCEAGEIAAAPVVAHAPPRRDVHCRSSSAARAAPYSRARRHLHAPALHRRRAGPAPDRLQKPPAPMSLNGRACIAGAVEHPTRKAPTDRERAVCMPRRLRRAAGCRADARRCGRLFSPATPGDGPVSMAEYLAWTGCGMSTATDMADCPTWRMGPCGGGDRARPLRRRAGHSGRRPRSEPATGTATGIRTRRSRTTSFEIPMGRTVAAAYAMCAMRPHARLRTPANKLAWIKVRQPPPQHNPMRAAQGGDGGGV